MKTIPSDWTNQSFIHPGFTLLIITDTTPRPRNLHQVVDQSELFRRQGAVRLTRKKPPHTLKASVFAYLCHRGALHLATGYCSVVKFSHKCSCIKQQCSGSCNLTHVCFYFWSRQKYDAKHGETLPKSKLLHEQKLKPFRILQVLHAEVCLVHGLHPAFKNLGNLNQKDGGFSSRGPTFGKLM